MTLALNQSTRGVIPIAPTPFHQDGAVNLDDVPRLVAYYECCGVVGITILGVMGEAAKLSPSEATQVIRAFVSACKGRLPVIVGVSDPSLAASCEMSFIARSEGAAAVMLQPMPSLGGDSDIVDYYQRFVESTGGQIPICVQDYPQSVGVTISVEAWSAISQFDSVFMLKHEPPAGLQKLSAIRAAEASGQAARVALFTSTNALHLPQELQRGADGAMVGVALSDVICTVCRLFWANQVEMAFDIFDAILPLVRHESQGGFGLAVRKEILRRRGALTQATLRYPSTTLHPGDRTELDHLLERATGRLRQLGLDFSLERPQVIAA